MHSVLANDVFRATLTYGSLIRYAALCSYNVDPTIRKGSNANTVCIKS